MDFLGSLARRVQNEIDEDVAIRDPGVPNLAVALTEGVAGRPADDYKELEFLITVALQWDISPERAAQLLAVADD
ncbi:hypothetical protein SALBM311S_10552 [Streptomyces alboniger]